MYSGEPKEVLNQEDAIRSVLEKIISVAVGGWIGVVSKTRR